MADGFWSIKKGLNFRGFTMPTNPVDGDVYFDTVQGFLGYNYGSWGPLGGGGFINYDTNPTIGSTAGYALYNNGAVQNPTTGTGGTVTNLTFASTSASPLVGHTMGVLTKAAANTQGEGLSYDFAIDSAFAPGVIQVSFQYQVSANFALSSGDPSTSPSDIQMWIYDITNATLIPVTPMVFVAGLAAPATYTGYFQTNLNSTNYRLIWHISTTNALSWIFNVANVIITPNVSSSIGGSAEVKARMEYSGTMPSTGSPILYNTVVQDNYDAYNPSTGIWTCPIAGDYIIAAAAGVLPTGSDQFQIIGIYVNGTEVSAGYFSNTSSEYRTPYAYIRTTLAVGDQVTGVWAGTSGLSNISSIANYLDITMVGANTIGYTPSTQAKTLVQFDGNMPSVGDPILYDIVAEDNYGSYNPSTGIWTCPISGTYAIYSQASVVAGSGSGEHYAYITIQKNGTPIFASITGQFVEGSSTDYFSPSAYQHLSLIAGDMIQVIWNGTSGMSTQLGVQGNYLDIIQVLPPPNQAVPASTVSRIVKSVSTGSGIGFTTSPVLIATTPNVICNGGDVEVGFMDDGSGNISQMYWNRSPTASQENTWPGVVVQIYRDATLISTQRASTGANALYETGSATPNSYRFIDTPPVGIHVYTLYAYTVNGDGGNAATGLAEYMVGYARPMA